jgi:hypothetical protein
MTDTDRIAPVTTDPELEDREHGRVDLAMLHDCDVYDPERARVERIRQHAEDVALLIARATAHEDLVAADRDRYELERGWHD